MIDNPLPEQRARYTVKALVKTGGFWSPPRLMDLPVNVENGEYVIVGTKWDGFRFPAGHVGTLYIPERKKKQAEVIEE